MKIVSDFKRRNYKQFYLIEFSYSYISYLFGNKKWFCRMWRKGWINDLSRPQFTEASANNKFTAYRNCLKEFKKII